MTNSQLIQKYADEYVKDFETFLQWKFLLRPEVAKGWHFDRGTQAIMAQYRGFNRPAFNLLTPPLQP